MKAFAIMGRSLKAAYDELFLCVYLSLLWWVGTLLILPAAPVTAGLHQVANRMANYKRVDSSFFWEAARTKIGKGWLLYLINLLLPAMIAFDIWFFFNSEGWLQILGVFFLWLLIYSLMVIQFTFPLFWQQDEPDIKLVLRNAALLALRSPLYTLLVLLFQLVLLTISAALTLPLIILAPALLAITANFALAGLLQEMGLAPEPPQPSAR
jgi:uncharacterized membrane protein YesL